MSDEEPTGDEEEKHAIARNVLELRRHRGMTQDELARAAGMAQQQISMVELRGCGLRTLARIAKALGVETAALLRRSGKD